MVEPVEMEIERQFEAVDPPESPRLEREQQKIATKVNISVLSFNNMSAKIYSDYCDSMSATDIIYSG